MDSLLSFPVGLFHPLQHAGFIPALSPNATFDPPYPGLWPWLGVPEAFRIADRLETLCLVAGVERSACLGF